MEHFTSIYSVYLQSVCGPRHYMLTYTHLHTYILYMQGNGIAGERDVSGVSDIHIYFVHPASLKTSGFFQSLLLLSVFSQPFNLITFTFPLFSSPFEEDHAKKKRKKIEIKRKVSFGKSKVDFHVLFLRL